MSKLKLKSQSLIEEFLPYLSLPFLIFLPFTISFAILFFFALLNLKSKKSLKVQTQLITSLLFIALASAILLATNWSKITGRFIGVPNVVEESIKVEVFANTSIDLKTDNGLISAKLSLDNGSFVPNQEIEFYVDGNFVGSNFTDDFGVSTFSFNITNASKVKAIFKGSEKDYLNPSEAEITIERKEEITTTTSVTTTTLPSENISENITIEAFSSVKNITKGKGDWKVVSIYGNVKYNGSLVNSKVKLRVKDVKGGVVFEDEQFVNGSFNFTFEILPKAYGKYSAEIFAESEFGNASKTFDFNVLKHIKVKPKVKQERFNYELGEKIRFEISAIDEDTGEIFPNATLQAFVVDPNGNITEVNYTQVAPGKFVVELDAEREFRPGLYKLKVKLSYKPESWGGSG